jgi:two-component system cell cycle sensor histidine kinase/response regulator CckA
MAITVLLVEDDGVLRMLFGSLLVSEGYIVMEASDGAAALQTLQTFEGTIHLLITDLGLPKFGGVDLIGRARALRPSIRILATSGLGPRNIQRMVMEAGADIFIPKPFSVPEVIEVIRKMHL